MGQIQKEISDKQKADKESSKKSNAEKPATLKAEPSAQTAFDKEWAAANADQDAAEAKAATQSKPVTFARSKIQQDKIGGNVIAGYESGYNLNGKKEDVGAADAAWASFKNAEKAGDVAGMDSASREFTRLATMISSPEYKQQMKELSDKQNNKAAKAVGPKPPDTVPVNKALEGGIFNGPDKNSVALNDNTMSANDVLTSMRESFSSVQKKTVESELPDLSKFNTMSATATTSGTSKKSNSMDILEKFTEIMEQKLSDVIDAISDNNNIKEEILLYSKA